MKKAMLFVLFLTGLLACRQQVNIDQNAPLTQATPLSLLENNQPAWQYEHLRLYPILAEADFIQENAAAADLMTLSEAIDTYGFRISEKKPYGRFEDAGAVNKLTVQNKTSSPVLLMGGDIIQGGRQDRVVSEDQIIAARSLQDIPVFCVEQGRWNYRDDSVEEGDVQAKHDRVFAFSGYYHVASGEIRQTLANSKSQEEVWDKVSRLTSHYAVKSHTGAYAALEGSDDFTTKRNAYLHFFDGKFADLDNVVGTVAVSGNRIIGTDVFGHPDLFKRQLTSLLHGYVTDAITIGQPPSASTGALQSQLNKANRQLNAESVRRYQNAITHFFVEGTGK